MRRMHDLSLEDNAVTAIDGHPFSNPIKIEEIENFGQTSVTIDSLVEGKSYIVLVYTYSNNVDHTTNVIFEVPFNAAYSASSSNGILKRNANSNEYYVDDPDDPSNSIQGVEVIQLLTPNT